MPSTKKILRLTALSLMLFILALASRLISERTPVTHQAHADAPSVGEGDPGGEGCFTGEGCEGGGGGGGASSGASGCCSEAM